MSEATDSIILKPKPLAIGLGWLGYGIILVLVLIRAMIEQDGFPMWAADPFMFSPPVIGLTPTKAIALNLGIVLSSCLVFMSMGFQRVSIGSVRSGLFVFGLMAIAFHSYTDIETVLPGSNILAVMSVLYVASFAHKFGHLQQLIAALTLSFSALLVIVGAYEMLVIHPATIASYEQTRDSFLASRGWSEGSFEMLVYERRLYQAEPIVWFGLTNVFASFCGACASGLFVIGWRMRSERRFSSLMYLAGAVSLIGLVLTGAKGGFGAFVLGLGLVVLAQRIPKWKIAGNALVMMCLLVMAGLVGRGLIGEGLGERSLFFRWQYMVGSVRMYIANWLTGVGPGHFQDAYAVYKPALSPENVSSPHNLPMNLIATLGLGGVALVLMGIATLIKIRPGIESNAMTGQVDRRRLVQLALIIVAIASVVSIRFGLPAMDTNLLLVQVIASIVWAGVVHGVVRQADHRNAIQWGMFAAGSVLAIHSIIEVTASWYVSGVLAALMVGASCTEVSSKPTIRGAGTVVTVSLLGCVLAIGSQFTTIAKWEHKLMLAAEPASRVSHLRSQMDSLEFSDSPEQVLREVAFELSAGSNTDASIDWIVPALNQFELDGRVEASDHLLQAIEIRPTHMPTLIAASSQLLWQAAVAHSMGDVGKSENLWDHALNILDDGVEYSSGAGGYQWVGNVWRGRMEQNPGDPNKDQWLNHAHSAWEIAYERSPYNPHLAYKLMYLSIERSEDDQAFHWAEIALLRHEQSRLDPLRGLDESDLMHVRTVLRSQIHETEESGP